MASGASKTEKDCRCAFEVFDPDKTGKITSKNLGKVLRSLGMNPRQEELDDIIRTLDVDGNGTIDLKEFTEFFCHEYGREDDDDVVKAAFETFDLDGNGKISRQELKQVMEKLGEKLTDKDLDALLSGLKLDDKGQLTYSDADLSTREHNIHRGRNNVNVTAFCDNVGICDDI